ncbi:hypothetical protein [Pantoea sp. CTOTU46764]|uniref:hypothetical protein n=1 Tax=Pantoea sp. CTOTU46764 TaxID=2953854 RepID=UPI00289ED296|nr:hypothetical protein [Pantoea sp. CTOTU46764]
MSQQEVILREKGYRSITVCRKIHVKTDTQKQKNRPWAVTTLLHIALILFGF